MIRLGQTNILRIIRDTPVGLFLGEDDSEVVLLPKNLLNLALMLVKRLKCLFIKIQMIELLLHV